MRKKPFVGTLAVGAVLVGVLFPWRQVILEHRLHQLETASDPGVKGDWIEDSLRDDFGQVGNALLDILDVRMARENPGHFMEYVHGREKQLVEALLLKMSQSSRLDLEPLLREVRRTSGLRPYLVATIISLGGLERFDSVLQVMTQILEGESDPAGLESLFEVLAYYPLRKPTVDALIKAHADCPALVQNQIEKLLDRWQGQMPERLSLGRKIRAFLGQEDSDR